MSLSPILKKLLFVRQFSIDNGKIDLLGGREIMLNASAILELQDIDETKLYDLGKKSGFKSISGAVEHAKVYKKMKDVFIDEIADLSKKIGQTDEGTIRMLQDIFNVYGLGEMSIQKIDNRGKEALVAVRESTIAQEWVSKYKKHSKSPVCTLTAGVLAGVFSYLMGKQIDCVETQCLAQGKSYCLFKIA
ncbi:MAG: 4-vinyl reductase [archaeon]|jgi:predicted hydrocarbon binding protein|nr:4-vinyl reductase [archaeon]